MDGTYNTDVNLFTSNDAIEALLPDRQLREIAPDFQPAIDVRQRAKCAGAEDRSRFAG